MEILLNKLSFLIHKRYNKKHVIKQYSYTKSDFLINVEYLSNRIKLKSYKAFLIFNSLDLSTHLSILFVLSNLYKVIIPTRKIALGFVNNINVYKSEVTPHVFNLLEIIHFNSKLLANDNKLDNGDISSRYSERVISLSDDVLEFYIGMYDIYMELNTKSYQDTPKILPETSIRLEPEFVINDWIRNIFLLKRSDFLENLFYNFKSMKKMSKMTYSYILHETVKQTFNREIKNLEIIITDTGFLLYYNGIEKEISLKLSKIFKFFFKIKKVEYLSRKLRKYKYTLFINKVYFYCCEEVMEKSDNIDFILSQIYLEDNQFYNLISEMENLLMKCMIDKSEFDEKSVCTLVNDMYKKTENDIFKVVLN